MLNFGYVLGILALVVLLPVFLSCLYLFVLTLFSLIPNWRKFSAEPSAKFAILLPVHNEEKKIEKAVVDLITNQDYNSELFDVVVIADNCTDSTAFSASFAGAKVFESTNDWKRGKGFCLEWAFSQLKEKDYDAFLIIDIDTLIDRKALRFLDAEISKGARAMQLSVTMSNSRDSWGNRFMDVVLAGTSYLRPKGRKNLGLSCGISGNGFCLTRELLKEVPYEAFDVIEGLEYHYKTVLNKEKVRFIPEAQVSCYYDINDKETFRQNERHRYRISRKYLSALMKAACCGNCSAFDCICELYTMSLKRIIFTLSASLITGGLLFFAAASLAECENLFWLSLWVLIPAILGIFMILCYICGGMVERRMPFSTWLAVVCYPFYLILLGFGKKKH